MTVLKCRCGEKVLSYINGRLRVYGVPSYIFTYDGEVKVEGIYCRKCGKLYSIEEVRKYVRR